VLEGPGIVSDLGQDGAVNDFLVTYLDTIDERLLEYVDEDEELSADVVVRLRRYTTALLDGSLTPLNVVREWPDWYSLAPAFVAAYLPENVEVMEEKATFMEAAETGEDVALTAADRGYLRELELYLDMYPEMRSEE